MSDAFSTRLDQPGLIVAPGVFDLISAKLADGPASTRST